MATTYRREVRRSIWRITERRDGDVFKTEHVEDRWFPLTDRTDGVITTYEIPGMLDEDTIVSSHAKGAARSIKLVDGVHTETLVEGKWQHHG